MKSYQPKTGHPCHCKRGVQRDNCPDCEGTGWRIDFAAIRERNRKKDECKIYVSTYCNFQHRVKDGKPIEHECSIIPPRALRAEMDGNYTLANDLIDEGKTMLRYGERCLPHMLRGVKATK